MSDAEFWRAIGAEVARRRAEAGYGSTFTFHRSNRGLPAIGTLDAIEAGRPGRVENLERYCQGLKVTVADVVRAVLAAEDAGETITDAERAVLTLHRDLTPKLRDSWLEVGRGLAALLTTRTRLPRRRPPA